MTSEFGRCSLKAHVCAGPDASSELAIAQVRIESRDEDAADPMSEPGCSLEESVWDAAVLVGISRQGLASSLWTVMLMLVSMLKQVIFAYIVSHYLAEKQIHKGTASGLRAWRTNVAHQLYVHVNCVRIRGYNLWYVSCVQEACRPN